MPYSSGPTNFRRDRGTAGEINLYRVNENIMSPTGRFCCVAFDAIGTKQTHCVHLGIIFKG